MAFTHLYFKSYLEHNLSAVFFRTFNRKTLVHTGFRFCNIFAICILAGCSFQPQYPPPNPIHQITLMGGHFYGPGPIEPDTPLPVGHLRGITFDLSSFRGYADFSSGESKQSFLSDGKTRINENIDAGILQIGGGSKPVLLVAVDGGHNKGREHYHLDKDYKMLWTVDIALDPGFADGIIRVDDFILNTGVEKIAQSVQTEINMPGGYDQAGSLLSGQYISGRLGDYDQDGYLDGIVVATPRVPLESNMLPGSPVGNQRGFFSDIKIPPHLACELTLRSILHFQDPINDLVEQGNSAEIVKMLKDIKERLETAEKNMDRAIFSGQWNPNSIKQEGFSIADRMETIKTLNFIALSLLDYYPTYAQIISLSARDSLEKMFIQIKSIIKKIAIVNEKTETQLPKV